MSRELRQHRRLEIRLPLECHRLDQGEGLALRSTTRNISAGGVYFEADTTDAFPPPKPRSRFAVEMTIPPGEGHFPYEGHVRGVAEVLRCESLTSPENHRGTRRVGVAARFSEPLKLVF